MTRGTITNKQTGLEITGELRDKDESTLLFKIKGTTLPSALHSHEWDFTPEPEPIKDGVYCYRGRSPEYTTIIKYREGAWRDAFGYALEDQNVGVSKLVRLVPEA